MFATNIEHSQYSSLQEGSPDYHHMGKHLLGTIGEIKTARERRQGVAVAVDV